VNVYKGMNPDLAFAAMLPPRVSNRYPMRIWGGAGSSFMINDASPNKEAAIRFLKWLSQAPQQTQLSKETLNLPSNRNSLGDLPPTLASFASRMDMTTHPSQWPVTEKPTVVEAFDKGIQSILIGEKTPAQVAADVQMVKEQLSQ
jgi:raffinose/stachyose/melibiose transport system substrate-binding protein